MIIKHDLSENWTFKSKNALYLGQTNLPTCNYLYLFEKGYIKDPFIGENEKELFWVSELDWVFEKSFNIDNEILSHKAINLCLENVDTIADVYLNENLIATLDNAHTVYRLPVTDKLLMGENVIRVYIHSPIKEAKKRLKTDKAPKHFSGITGFSLIRKPAYHFGWDWGPVLPPSGINGGVFLELEKSATIEDLRIRQIHKNGIVKLNLNVNIKDFNQKLGVKFNIYDPENKCIIKKELNASSAAIEENIIIENPKLWCCNNMNGLKEQPLYRVECVVEESGKAIDKRDLKIGLREIRLNLKKQNGDNDFCFLVNGKRIFAKGANWIPADSFISRITDKKLEYYIKSIAECNFNMLRIWGGGVYASDTLMDLCDKYGILVWHDFMFACAPYPFGNTEFLNSVMTEITQNIVRIRHHASLALLCGNNEIEAMSMGWVGFKKMMQKNKEFFYDILPKEVKKLSDCDYFATSPGSGEFKVANGSDDIGDTHIWSVWHGMMDFDYFLKRNTLFCSEFGFESLPSIATIKAILTSEKELALQSGVMKSHQKCAAGNARILYYMIDNYGIPKDFGHLVYLSQLTQAESIRIAVEHWRRNTGRCNGALYWQLNDCWHTFSWSSIDYLGNFKALQYAAKEFFKPLCVSVAQNKNELNISVINETGADFNGFLEYAVKDFDGNVMEAARDKIEVSDYNVKKVFTIDTKYCSFAKNKCYLSVNLVDENGNVIDNKCQLLTKDKKARLNVPNLSCKVQKIDDGFEITLSADTYVRKVMLETEDVTTIFSQNFFDMEPNKIYKVYAKNNENLTSNRLNAILNVTYYQLTSKRYSSIREKLLKYKIALMPVNFFNRIIYRFM